MNRKLFAVTQLKAAAGHGATVSSKILILRVIREFWFNCLFIFQLLTVDLLMLLPTVP